MTAGPAREAALDHLYRGQSNDAYWHGLFGASTCPIYGPRRWPT